MSQLFLPESHDPGCTVQACGLRDNMDELKKPAWKCWASAPISQKSCHDLLEKELLNFTLLSDEDHQVCEQFSVWGEKTFMGKTYDGFSPHQLPD